MAKWIAAAIGIFIALSLLIGACNYARSWGDKAGEVVSPDNVEKQNTILLDDWEQLQKQARIACKADKVSHEEGDPTLLEDPSVAYDAVYESTAVDFNRRMGNLYEAQAVKKLPLPSNLKSLPTRAPTLKEMQAQVC